LSARLTIADYGVGNLFSVRGAFEHCGGDCVLTSDARAVARADRLLIPGVGAFGDAMADLREKGLDDAVRRFAATGRPLLGICLGMQLLLERSHEFGVHDGLGLVAGEVVAIPASTASGAQQRLPHVGWAPLGSGARAWAGSILEDVSPGSWFYFVHSYMAEPAEAGDRLAECDYGGRRVCAVYERGNVMGCQFHPEKSGAPGLAVIRRFLGR
jgi:imidazole glycerol-phosphate synthase subunit HisH